MITCQNQQNNSIKELLKNQEKKLKNQNKGLKNQKNYYNKKKIIQVKNNLNKAHQKMKINKLNKWLNKFYKDALNC